MRQSVSSSMAVRSLYFLRMFLPIYMALIAFGRAHLWDPPYWDALTGVYTQSVWLARHHFDYRTLFHLPQFSQGGPNIQFFSLFSLMFALLVRFASPPTTFFVLHTIILGASALTICLAFKLLRSACSTVIAMVWVLSAALNPIWLGQSLSLYLELPLAAAIFTSIYFVWKENYAAASAFCLLSFFIKDAALLYGLTCFLFAGVMGLLRTTSKRDLAGAPPDMSVGFLAVPFPIMLLLGLHNRTNFHAFSDVRGYFLFFLSKLRFQYPSLAVELFVLVALFAAAISRPSQRRLLGKPSAALQALFVGGFWISFVVNTFPLPRYTMMVIFPMTCLLGLLLASRPALALGIGVPVLLFNLINAKGSFLPAIPKYRGGRSGHELERSCEYLTDLEANRRICRILEDHYSGIPIVCKWPFTQMLRVPEFGYVRHPLPYALEAGANSMICDTFPLMWFMNRPGSHQAVCIYSPTNNEFEWGVSLRPKTTDRILFIDTSLPETVIIYRRDWTLKDIGHPLAAAEPGL